MKHYLKNTIFFLILGGALFSCAPVKYIPVEGRTEVVYRDSTIFRTDTIKVDVPVEVIKEVVPALDTLTMETSVASAWAALDTNTRTLQGAIENKHTALSKPIEIKERIVYRDSIVTQEVPVPVEVEKRVRYVPFIYKLLSLFGAIALACLAWKYGKKYVLRWIA